MKLLLSSLSLAVLTFVAVCLGGTVLEYDAYHHGSRTRVTEAPEPLPWLPPGVTLTRNERTAWLVDVDGWYQLWNAGRKTLYYADGAYFAGDLNNRTATSPSGEWILDGTASGKPFAARYVLAFGTFPGMDAVMHASGVALPRRIEWLTRRCRSDRGECAVTYWWELAP